MSLPQGYSSMPTGTLPRAMAVSAEPWPRVTTRLGLSLMTASPRALLRVTGNAPAGAPDAEPAASSFFVSSEPHPVTMRPSETAAAPPRGRGGEEG